MEILDLASRRSAQRKDARETGDAYVDAIATAQRTAQVRTAHPLACSHALCLPHFTVDIRRHCLLLHVWGVCWLCTTQVQHGMLACSLGSRTFIWAKRHTVSWDWQQKTG